MSAKTQTADSLGASAPSSLAVTVQGAIANVAKVTQAVSTLVAREPDPKTVPMYRDSTRFPLPSFSNVQRVVPYSAGYSPRHQSALSAPAGSVGRSTYTAPPLPAPVKWIAPTAEELFGNFPEAFRESFSIPGRHDLLSISSVVVYEEADFKHAVDKTPFNEVYLAYPSGGFLLHQKRDFNTHVRMKVDRTTIAEYKPRFRVTEEAAAASFEEFSKALTRKNLKFEDLRLALVASKYDVSEFLKPFGMTVADLAKASTAKLSKDFDLQAYLPEGKKIPIALLNQVVALFKEVCKQGHSNLEAHVQIVWTPGVTDDQGNTVSKGRYEVRVPTQRVTGGSVSYDHDAFDPITEMCVMDIHSHS